MTEEKERTMTTPRSRARSALVVLGLAGALVLGIAIHDPVTRWLNREGQKVNAAPAAQSGASSTASPEQKKERTVLYWVDAMNPANRSDKPGKASDGMDLVPVYADEGPGGEVLPPGSIRISPEKQQLIGVQYGTVTESPVSETRRAVGKITYDETRITHVHTKFEGWIDRVFVDFIGKLIEKNQPLLTVYSPELVSTQQELLIAKKGKEYLGSNSNHEIAGNALSLYQSARERLRLWDISDQQIQELEERGTPVRCLTLFSPFSGFVLARNAFENQRITPDTELYTIVDLSTVWVQADVYEYELPKISLGQTATMSLSYFPGRTYTGKVAYIYPQLDNMTRTAKVRLEFPNPDFELKPEMYANIELKFDYGRQISVPEEAVLDSGSEQIVFVARDEGYFEPRRIRLGAKVDQRYIVLGGLKRGEKIVTSGNFLVDSESRLKSAMGAMEGMPGMTMEPEKKSPGPEEGKSISPVPNPPMEAMPGMKMGPEAKTAGKSGPPAPKPPMKKLEHQHER
jgi:multidrug efflux pump subunit AcrA (membrane-fusion protein)